MPGTVGRLGRRAARKEHRAATEQAGKSRARISTRWGATPVSSDQLTRWTSRAAARITEHDPRVTEAQQAVQTARDGGAALEQRHRQERRTLLADIFGAEVVRRDPLRYELTRPDREAAQAANTAAKARRETAHLRELPVQDAVARIKAQREATEQTRLAREARAHGLNGPDQSFDHGRTGPHREGPTLRF